MEFVVFDLETTGLSAERDEIIEIGAARWQGGTMIDSFHSLVRPSKPISDDIQKLTNITPDELAKAPSIEEVLPQFLRYIDGQVLAGYNVGFDVKFIRAACDELGYVWPTTVDTLDALSLAHVLMPLERDFRLVDVTGHLGLQVETAHRALADAMTTGYVIEGLRTRALTLPYVTLQQLTRLASMYSPVHSTWFSECAEVRFQHSADSLPDDCDVIHQMAFSTRSLFVADGSKHPSYENELEMSGTSEEDNSSEDVTVASSKLLSSDSPLASILPGFEVRPGQMQMVQAVADAFQGDQHLIAEAGTGTGKSLAYLIPSALYAVERDSRVIVSTHTIALQDQIEKRDFPMLRSAVSSPLSLAVLKGRTHYVCMRKVWQEVRNTSFGVAREEIEAYMSFLVWLVLTTEGTREEIHLPGLGQVWPRVQSETETCINKRCPFFKPCFYFRARSRAYDADVVVTNHSLVFSDLKADHRVLPKYDKLVLDEAHHLEDEATKHLGDQVHWLQCNALMGRLVRENAKQGVLPELIHRLTGSDSGTAAVLPTLESLVEQLQLLRNQIDEGFQILGRFIPPGQAEYRFTTDVERSAMWAEYLRVTDDMFSTLKRLEEARATLQDAAERESDEELAGRMFDASGFFAELFGHVHILCSAGELHDEWVVWVERTSAQQRHMSLNRAPIDVAAILERILFDKKSSVVLTSATLSAAGKFDYVKERLGLVGADMDGRLVAMSVPSPFAYERQALLCVPTDVPELAKMDSQEAATWLSDALYHLGKASGGRLLALFTSHAMLRATAEAVRDPLRSAGIEVFAQGIDGSRSRILEAFKHHPQSVLLGAQSFWEGIDLPGDQLTTLVIVRLPFSPPTHPVTQARHERLEQGGKSAFWAASLPEAVVRFRQGFGRLIRTVSDRGVVVVYDKRIITQRYGQNFIKSLPGVRPYVAPERDVIDRVRQFLHQA